MFVISNATMNFKSERQNYEDIEFDICMPEQFLSTK